MLTRKPVKGDVVRWPNSKLTYTVVRTPDENSNDRNLCWIRNNVTGLETPFIWRHPEGLNTLAEIVEAQ